MRVYDEPYTRVRYVCARRYYRTPSGEGIGASLPAAPSLLRSPFELLYRRAPGLLRIVVHLERSYSFHMYLFQTRIAPITSFHAERAILFKRGSSAMAEDHPSYA